VNAAKKLIPRGGGGKDKRSHLEEAGEKLSKQKGFHLSYGLGGKAKDGDV